MRTRIVVTARVSVVVMLILSFSATAETNEFSVVSSDQIAGILSMIANRVHDNFLCIHTWQGETSVTRYVTYKGARAENVFKTHTRGVGKIPEELDKMTESTTTFNSDLDKGFFYAEVTQTSPSLYVDRASEKEIPTSSIPRKRVSILTSQYHLHCSPSRIKDGCVIQRKAIKEALPQEQGCQSGQPAVFDPRELFDFRSPVWEQFPRILKYMREKGVYAVDGQALKVEQRQLPGEVQYRVHMPGKISLNSDNIWMIYIFSSKVGYNMLSSEQVIDKGRIFHRRSFEYQPVDGIYVPSKVTYETFDPEDGNLSQMKTQIFEKVSLNHLIPVEKFTYKSLGLEEGDVFEDRILDKKYIYKQGEFVEAPKNK